MDKTMPWECPQCHERIEPQFDICWKCQYSKLAAGSEVIIGEGPDQPLCIGCLEPVGEHDDFCRACGTPLSTHAAIAPIQRIYAEGDTYWKATHGSVNKIIFWGMWLIFGPCIFMCLEMFPDIDVGLPKGWGVLFGLLVLIFFTVIYGLILWKVTRNYLRSKGKPTGQAVPHDR